MTASERILQTLGNSPDGLCDDCLSIASGVTPRQQVYQRATELFQDGKIFRNKRSCSSCKKFKLVNSINPHEEKEKQKTAPTCVSTENCIKLNDYGFVSVGKWTLNNRVKSGISFELSSLRDERVIYAFSVDDDVKYIGVCDTTNTTLNKRMNRYQSMAGAGTNERLAKQIKGLLEQGKTVNIFALKPISAIQYKDLNVDLIKGLENPLIEKLKTEWNRHK
jgi:hypothetical protein